jgi:hypothetical protein
MPSITTALANSFKLEVLDGVHAAADVYKCALIKAGYAGTFDKTIDNYSDLGTDEVANGNGYVTGGQVLAGRVSALTGDVANVTWADPVWDPATIAADGVVIYNSSKGNKVVMVGSFGGTVASTNGPFTADLPASGAAALIRIN